MVQELLAEEGGEGDLSQVREKWKTNNQVWLQEEDHQLLGGQGHQGRKVHKVNNFKATDTWMHHLLGRHQGPQGRRENLKAETNLILLQ